MTLIIIINIKSQCSKGVRPQSWFSDKQEWTPYMLSTFSESHT